MGYELQVISFLCAALLAILALLPRIRGNIANMAIVLWLFTCNLIHGINAVIWADNIDLHVPVWCDIASRVLLGAFVALPGACVCIAGRMELLSSKRRIPDDPKSQQARLIVEITFCYIIPILYVALHLIAQDHRFDLVRNYGCSASIFPSGPTLAVMYVPPLLLCALSFGLNGRAIHNSCLKTASDFSLHIESRAPVNTSIFARRTCLSLFLTGVLFILTLFNVFATNGYQPWISFADAHKNMWVIKILFTGDEAAPVRAAWWVIPVVSIVYLLFMFILGEEVREGYSVLRDWSKTVKKPRFGKNVLPLHFTKRKDERRPAARVVQDTAPRPLTLSLRSGWDDMLDEPKSSGWSLNGKKSASIGRAATPTTTCGSRSASPLPRINTNASDDAFIAATMDYVTSPTARSLGIGPSKSPLSPPPVYLAPIQTRFDEDPFRVASPPNYSSPTSRRDAAGATNPFRSPTPKQASRTTSPETPSSLLPPTAPFARRAEDVPPTPQSVPKDVDAESVMSNVLDEYWPQPPPTPVTPSLRSIPSPIPAIPAGSSRDYRRPSSRASSIDTSGSTLWSVPEDNHASKPFQGPGITPPLSIATKVQDPQPRQQRGLRRMLSVESKYSTASTSSASGIYMTVVKETISF